MPRTCTICAHGQRSSIEEDIVKMCSLRDISGRFDVSKSALDRHVNHISDLLNNADKHRGRERRKRLFTALNQTHVATRRILQAALGAKNLETSLRAIARIEKQIELHARLGGDLNEHTEEPQQDFTQEQWAGLHELIGKKL